MIRTLNLFVDENFDNDVDSDDEPLTALIPEANIHVVKVLAVLKVQLRQIWKKVTLNVRRKASKKVRGRVKKKQPKRRVLTCLLFLGINYVMSINKLPKIKSYWECGQYVRNEGIRNTMSRSRFEKILQNFHFSDNTKDDKSDKGYKV